MFWNVLPMPRREILYGLNEVISCPLKCILPSAGLKNPLIRLKAVVLPEPLGPMRAVMVLSSISNHCCPK